MKVEIWSDVVCPWCYIGKRRFEKAVASLSWADDIEVVWRSFELDPQAPRNSDISSADRLSQKYGITLEQARQANWQMTARAMQEGLEYNLDKTQPANTLDAHRLIHLAGENGCQDAMKERLLRGYFTEGEAIANHDVLLRLAADVGLGDELVGNVLRSSAYEDEVREDEERARILGITGVPFFLVDGSVRVEGAQPAGVLVQILLPPR
jgi:predicted DsbA family dithiol-disulfide isomerase